MTTEDTTTQRVNGTDRHIPVVRPEDLVHEPAADARLLGADERGTELSAGHAPTAPATGPGETVNGHLIDAPRPQAGPGERQPILPPWVRDRQIAREVTGRRLDSSWYAARYRAVHLLPDLARIVKHAAVGARRVSWRVLRWAWDLDGHPVYGHQPAETDKVFVRMANDRTLRQKWRLSLIAALTVVLAVVLAVLWVWATPWLGAVTAAAVLVLSRHGRPAGTKLFSPAVVREMKVPLTDLSIIEALSALGIAALTRSLQENPHQIWRSRIVAVRGGHEVEIRLPASVLAADLIPHEQRLAHALDRQADCVIVEPVTGKTPGHLILHILDRPVLASLRGPGPLAKARKASWWSPVSLGLTRTGKQFTLHLRGGAWFIGGQPNSGKSSLCRLAAAHTALDPRARLSIVNLKGSPGYIGLKSVCHRYLSGSPEVDKRIIARTIRLLEELLEETARRNEFLTRLVEQGLADSDDVTEDLAHRYPELQPWTVVLDEFHRMFDPTVNPDVEYTERLIGDLLKACRSAGITLILATQLAGTESIPAGAVRAARIRGCLTVQDEVSWRQIFGNAGKGSYAASGVNTLPSGVVILKAEDGAPTKVGTWFIELSHLRVIGERAEHLRRTLHVLSGDAVGDTLPEPVAKVNPVDLLTHVLQEIPGCAPTGGKADQGVAWLRELEEALGKRQAYAGRAAGWLPAELDARRVPTEPINRKTPGGEKEQRTTLGVRAAAVQNALQALLDG